MQWVKEHYGQAVLDRWLATNHLGSWAQPDKLLNGTAVSSEELVSRFGHILQTFTGCHSIQSRLQSPLPPPPTPFLPPSTELSSLDTVQVAWAALFTTIDPNLACTTRLQKAFSIINGLAFYSGIVTMLLVSLSPLLMHCYVP